MGGGALTCGLFQKESRKIRMMKVAELQKKFKRECFELSTPLNVAENLRLDCELVYVKAVIKFVKRSVLMVHNYRVIFYWGAGG